MNGKPFGTIYVASKVKHAPMWLDFQKQGYCITSSWIGIGIPEDYGQFWDRCVTEVCASSKLVLYAEPGDFPLKGALIEAGVALSMVLPVIVCLPGVELQGVTYQPIGSWIRHPQVRREDDIVKAMRWMKRGTRE